VRKSPLFFGCLRKGVELVFVILFAQSSFANTIITNTRAEVSFMATLWETDTLNISPLANAQYPQFSNDWQYLFPHSNISSDGDIPSGVFNVASYGAVGVGQSIQLLCLRGTELEDAVESLRNSEGHGGGVGRAAIGPACGGTCGDHFPGRRGEPGYEVR
jgi:hypothetical protein